MEDVTTLARFVIDDERRHGREAGAFSGLLNDVATACKRVSHLVRRGELAGVLGAAGHENVQGEDQKKLDVLTNEVFIDSMEHSGLLAGIASEEMDAHYPIPERYPRGPYLLCMDPLDGSSNIDIDGSTGTIFSIVRHEGKAAPADADFLRPGREQVCAGYCLYSSATMLVLTLGHGAHGFTLDDGIGEFVLTHPDMSVPRESTEFAINAAYARHWHPPVRRYVEECQAGRDGPRGADFNMRWTGSMVGDVHRILCRGGVFLYPGDAKLDAAGKSGKLRLLYEANPMGMLVEQAGGLAHTGMLPILDVEPASLHQRIPVLMGSADEIERLVRYHADG